MDARILLVCPEGTPDGLTPEQVGAFFESLLASPWSMTWWMGLVVGGGAVVCGIGLRAGVERVMKVMMAGLFVIMFLLAIRSVTLPGAEEGLAFYLKPSLQKLTQGGVWNSLYAALAQSFFTLSIGFGTMMIFGSNIDKERSLTGEALWISFLDTLVALFAGLIIFPACFAYGVDVGTGPRLIFISLPNMFGSMPLGCVWSTLFFLFMTFAAMSSIIAVFEHTAANMIDNLGWGRRKACVINFLIIFLGSLPCVLGFNVWAEVQPLGPGSTILDLEDFFVSNNLLPLGAIVYILFCCTRHGWGWDHFIAEVDTGRGLKFPKAMRFYLVYIMPAVMGYIEKFSK